MTTWTHKFARNPSSPPAEVVVKEVGTYASQNETGVGLNTHPADVYGIKYRELCKISKAAFLVTKGSPPDQRN